MADVEISFAAIGAENLSAEVRDVLTKVEQQLNTAFSGLSDSPGLNQVARRIEGIFSEAAANIATKGEDAVAEFNRAFQRLGTGADLKGLGSQLQTILREAVSGVGPELASLNREFPGTFPAQEIGRLLANAITTQGGAALRELLGQFSEATGVGRRELGGQAFQPTAAFRSAEPQVQRALIQPGAREAVIGPHGVPDIRGFINASDETLTHDAAIERYSQEMEKAALQRLNGLQATAIKEDQIRDKRLAAEQAEADAAEQSARAVALRADIGNGVRNVTGGFVRDDSEVFRKTRLPGGGEGAIEETDPARHQAALQANTAQAEREAAAAARAAAAAEKRAAADLRSAASAERLAAEEEALSQKGLLESFSHGFFGEGGSKRRGGANDPTGNAGLFGGFFNGLSETAGIVAKYQILAIAINDVTRGASESVKQFVQLDQASNELNLQFAQGDGASGTFINNLQNIAASAGQDVVGAMQAATLAIAAFGQESDKAGKQAIGADFARGATQLATITGTDTTASAQQGIAVGNSFNEGANGVTALANAVAVAHETFGSNSKEVAAGVAALGEVGAEAGYSLDQLAQVIGLVQAKTAQGGTAIATSLQRVFALFQGGAGQNELVKLGIDPGGTVKQQIETLAAAFPKMSQAQRDSVVVALGGAKALQALLPLLEDNTKLQASFSKAITDGNAAQREQDAITGSISGQLHKLGIEIKNIGSDVLRTGFLAPLEAVYVILEPILRTVDHLLQLFDALPAPVRGLVSSIADLVIAYRIFLGTAARKAAVDAEGKAAAVGASEATVAGLEAEAAATNEATAATERLAEARAQAAVSAKEATAATATTAETILPLRSNDRVLFGENAAREATLRERLALGASAAGQNIRSDFNAGRGARNAAQVQRDFEAATAAEAAQLELAASAKALARADQRVAVLTSEYDRVEAAGIATQEELNAAAAELLVAMQEQTAASTRLAVVSGEAAVATEASAGAGIAGGLGKGASFLGANAGLLAGGAALFLGTSIFGNAKSQQEADATLGRVGGPTTNSPQDLNENAAALNQAADHLASSGSGLSGVISQVLVPGLKQGNKADIEAARAQADNEAAQAKAVQAAQAEVSSGRSPAVNDFLGAFGRQGGIAGALQALSVSGADARTQMSALIQAISLLGDASGHSAGILTDQEQNLFSGGAPGTVKQILKQANSVQPLGRQFGNSDIDAVGQALQSQFAGILATNHGNLTTDARKQLRDAAIAQLQRVGDKDAVGDAALIVQDLINASGLNTPAGQQAQLGEAATAAAQTAQQAGQEAGSAASLAGGNGTQVAAQTTLTALQQARQQLAAKGATAQQLQVLDDQITATMLDAQKATIAGIEAQGALAAASIPPSEVLATDYQKLATLQQVAAATTDAVAKAQADAAVAQQQQQIIQDQLTQAQGLATTGVRTVAGGKLTAFNPQDTVGLAGGQVQADILALNTLPQRDAQTGQITAAYAAAVEKYFADLHAQAQASVDLANSTLGAAELLPLSPLLQARTTLQQAANTLSILTPGTTAYNQALSQYFAAQHALNLAIATNADQLETAFINPEDTIGQALAKVHAAVRAEHAGANPIGVSLAQLHQALLDLARARAQLADDKALAGIPVNDTVLNDRVRIQNAERDLKTYKIGTDAYYQKLRELADLKHQLAEDEAALANAQIDASIDPRDTLGKAEGAIQKAINQLKADAGDPTKEAQDQASLNQARVDLIQAQTDYAVAVNDAYNINYFDPVSVARGHIEDLKIRLANDLAGTKQFLDDLTALKRAEADFANTFQGQFNIGNITLPTPYEVRAAVQAGGFSQYAASQTSQVIYIDINGADVAMVKSTLGDLLGTGSLSTGAVQPARKVAA